MEQRELSCQSCGKIITEGSHCSKCLDKMILSQTEEPAQIAQENQVKHPQIIDQEQAVKPGPPQEKKPVKLWLPGFPKRNPFSLQDAGVEEDLPFIETEMVERLRNLIEAEQNTIICGDRGSGKTAVVSFADRKISKDIFNVAGSKSLADLLSKIVQRIDEGVGRSALRNTLKSFAERFFDTWNSQCRGCRDRCHFDEWFDKGLLRDFYEPRDILGHIKRYERTCLLRQEAVLEVFGRPTHHAKAFVLDAPDNLHLKDIHDFTRLCQRLLGGDAPLIIFCTPSQWGRLRRLDTFARLHFERFQKPTVERLCEIFRKRIEQASEGREVRFPLTEEAVREVATRSRTVRKFLQTIGLVLAKMKAEDRAEPGDPAFVRSLGLWRDTETRDTSSQNLSDRLRTVILLEPDLKPREAAEMLGIDYSQQGGTIRKLLSRIRREAA